MKKTTKISISLSVFLIIFSMLVVPTFSSAAGLVPCGGTGEPVCDFNAFMKLINDGITFILRTMVLPIAAIMFAYAGFLMVTSGGSTEARGKAKNIFSNTVLGLVIAVAAWLIVKTILSILGFDGAWIFGGF